MTGTLHRIAAVAAVLALLGAGVAGAIGTAGASSDAPPATLQQVDEDELDGIDVPDAVGVNESVTLDATKIADREGVSDVCWRFGEDGECQDAEVTRTFESAGEYVVTVIVTDEDGDRTSATKLITATEPPTAALDAPDRVEAGATVELDASGTTDDHGIDAYEWDLTGDGTVDVTTDEPTVEHAFESADDREVTVTAVDEAGQRDEATASVQVVEASDDGSQPNDGGAAPAQGAVGGIVVVLGKVAILTLAVIAVGGVVAARYRD